MPIISSFPSGASGASEKQDKLTGKEGQVVGFDAQGNAVAEDANFLPAENGENGSLILNDVYFNGNSVKEVNLLEVAELQIMTPGGVTPDARIIAGARMADFSTIDLRVPDTPQSALSATSKDYVDKTAKPLARQITLTTGGWNATTKQQTVTVSGVLADESKQLIHPMPAAASQTAYMEAGIRCAGQAENSLTFTCDTVPTAAITVYVTIQEVRS